MQLYNKKIIGQNYVIIEINIHGCIDYEGV